LEVQRFLFLFLTFLLDGFLVVVLIFGSDDDLVTVGGAMGVLRLGAVGVLFMNNS